MKILIDINHPAHVHYFRNFIKIMENKGHEFLIISRNKEIEHYLLNKYKINFIDRGCGRNSFFKKIIYLVRTNYKIYKIVKRFQPRILLSFDSVYLSLSSIFLNADNIIFDDTEHASIEHLLSFPFAKHIITPDSYILDLGAKHIKFNGFMEQCYLLPKYYQSDINIYDFLNLKKRDRFVLLRFISWNAVHDVGQKGLTLENKRELVENISKYAKVFISSEKELPEDLKKYQIKIPAEKMHNVLNEASLLIGESGTMASECAMLGTPAFFINTLTAGTLEEQQDSGLLFMFKSFDGVLNKSIEILSTPKHIFLEKRDLLLKKKIDVTAFMVWFIENYPKSAKIMKENPDYQNRFK